MNMHRYVSFLLLAMTMMIILEEETGHVTMTGR
ncbi:unnamed protein product [Larinioides sclopetarius]|uniref:Uncharacterized protein n=1 Tax=Larinioides sclopetarius TaxID=280406 RepID=A0AAV2AQC8_9ARAC